MTRPTFNDFKRKALKMSLWTSIFPCCNNDKLSYNKCQLTAATDWLCPPDSHFVIIICRG